MALKFIHLADWKNYIPFFLLNDAMKKIEISPDLFPTPTLFYDGVCNLCHSSVQWIIKRDKHDLFHFESLQSEAGQQIINKMPPDVLTSDSVILVLNGRIYLYADASLMVMKQLGGVYNILGKTGFLIPESIRNLIYRFIASNRYQWFGRREVCDLPEKRMNSGTITLFDKESI